MDPAAAWGHRRLNRSKTALGEGRVPSWSDRQADLAALAQRQLFFVGGAPRSGTTWVQHILDSHPDVSCRGEGTFPAFPGRTHGRPCAAAAGGTGGKEQETVRGPGGLSTASRGRLRISGRDRHTAGPGAAERRTQLPGCGRKDARERVLLPQPEAVVSRREIHRCCPGSARHTDLSLAPCAPPRRPWRREPRRNRHSSSARSTRSGSSCGHFSICDDVSLPTR